MDNKWDHRFLELAQYVSSWSRDPSTKVGAIIVDQNNIIKGVGFNGFPRGVADSPDRYDDRDTKLQMIVHAEVNAILNANGPVRGCKLYIWPTLMLPTVCSDCAKVVIQAGIKEIYYWHNENCAPRWQEKALIVEQMFDEAGIKCCALEIEELI